MEIIVNKILSVLKKLLGLLFQGGATASLRDIISSSTRQTSTKILSSRKKLVNLYKKHSYQWAPDKDIILIQDYSHPEAYTTFNDFVILKHKGKFVKWKCTGEGGSIKDSRYWRSKFDVGQYLNLYYVASGHFPKYKDKSIKLPFMKMAFAIYVISLETSKRRKAGDCHLHGRISKNEAVKKSSMGCLVLKDAYHGIQTFIKCVRATQRVKKNKRAKFHFTVININEASFIHEIPFYEEKT